MSGPPPPQTNRISQDDSGENSLFHPSVRSGPARFALCILVFTLVLIPSSLTYGIARWEDSSSLSLHPDQAETIAQAQPLRSLSVSCPLSFPSQPTQVAIDGFGVWPQPKAISMGSQHIQLSHRFSFSVGDLSPPEARRVGSAFQRTCRVLQLETGGAGSAPAPPAAADVAFEVLQGVEVHITGSNATGTRASDGGEGATHLPYLGMDESYELRVAAPLATITAASLHGALRALESLSQLPLCNGTILRTPIAIEDAPLFPWRGLSLDTARHYHPVPFILRLLDAMAFNKLNTLHWHIVDAQSFPLHLTARPQMAAAGAFAEWAQYDSNDVSTIVAHAASLSIRVVPEIDLPAHSASWGQHPSLAAVVARCPHLLARTQGNKWKKMDKLALDVSANLTWDVIADVLSEAASLFPDPFFHVGGDEVDTGCWSEVPHIRQYMTHNKLNVHSMYTRAMSRAISLVLSHGKRPVVWQGAFDQGVPFPKQAVIEGWKCWSGLAETAVATAAKRGHDVLQSQCWYLDWPSAWWDYYEHTPTPKGWRLRARSWRRRRRRRRRLLAVLSPENSSGGSSGEGGDSAAGAGSLHLSEEWAMEEAAAAASTGDGTAKGGGEGSGLSRQLHLHTPEGEVVWSSHPDSSDSSNGGSGSDSSRPLVSPSQWAGIQRAAQRFHSSGSSSGSGDSGGDSDSGGGGALSLLDTASSTIAADADAASTAEGEEEEEEEGQQHSAARRLSSSPLVGSMLGGEVCMWSEGTDWTNLGCRVWPRAAAVAERLWSAQPSPAALFRVRHATALSTASAAALPRFRAMHQRLLRRGVRALPLPPSQPPASATASDREGFTHGYGRRAPRLACPLISQDSMRPPPTVAPFRVISYNIKNGGGERLDAITAWVRSQSASVLAAVELNGWSEALMTKRAAAMGFPFSAFLHTSSGYHIGLMAAYPVTVRLRRTAGFSHGLLHAVVRGTHYIVTHLGPHSALKRRAEAAAVAALVSPLVAAGARVVVLGDLNTLSPVDSEWHRSEGLLQFLRRPAESRLRKKLMTSGDVDYVPMTTLLDAGLHDLCALSNSTVGTQPGAAVLSYHSIPRHCLPSEPTGMPLDQAAAGDVTTPSFRLDYILATANIARTTAPPTAPGQATAAAVHSNVVRTAETDGMSDHYPIVLTLPPSFGGPGYQPLSAGTVQEQ